MIKGEQKNEGCGACDGSSCTCEKTLGDYLPFLGKCQRQEAQIRNFRIMYGNSDLLAGKDCEETKEEKKS